MKTQVMKLIPVLLVSGLIWAMMGFPPYARVGYAPNQPVRYSHEVHAGKYNIDCQYCHTGVTTGKKAGVPSVNICMNCHQGVFGENTNAEELFKFTDAEKKALTKGEARNVTFADLIDNFTGTYAGYGDAPPKSPEWIRIHNMPDHVKFSHGPHLKALLKPGQPSKEACMPCHGNVAGVKGEVAQVESLNMGFCINCHRENASKGARTNCTACHY